MKRSTLLVFGLLTATFTTGCASNQNLSTQIVPPETEHPAGYEADDAYSLSLHDDTSPESRYGSASQSPQQRTFPKYSGTRPFYSDARPVRRPRRLTSGST